jgi:hypothetical protein
MRAMRKRRRWKRTATCPWRLPRMKINCVPKVARPRPKLLGVKGRSFSLALSLAGTRMPGTFSLFHDGLGPSETTISRGTCRFTD